MTGINITPFVASVPIVDPQTGLPTEYFVKTIFPYFQRLGGYIDLIYQGQLAANTGDATLAEVAATTQENAFRLQNLQALVAGGLAESLQQEISDLRQEIARLSAQIQGIRGEDNAAQVQQVQVTVTQVGNTVASLTTSSVPEGANQYFTQARARASISASGSVSYNSTTGEISYTAPTLAAVATSGAYADLTGKPSLATVATSGDYNDLTNKPVGAYTATPGTITGYVDIVDSGGTTRKVAVTT